MSNVRRAVSSARMPVRLPAGVRVALGLMLLLTGLILALPQPTGAMTANATAGGHGIASSPAAAIALACPAEPQSRIFVRWLDFDSGENAAAPACGEHFHAFVAAQGTARIPPRGVGLLAASFRARAPPVRA